MTAIPFYRCPKHGVVLGLIGLCAICSEFELQVSVTSRARTVEAAFKPPTCEAAT